jgi:quercetin dioxygenase-like cupin family protein
MAANNIQKLADKVFELQKQSKSIVEELELEYQQGDDNYIELKSFSGLKVGDVIELAPGVNSSFVAQTSEELIFVVVSEQDGNVGSHHHDFKEEIKVIKGKLLEKISNILLEEKDVMVVHPFKSHNFVSQTLSIYTVKINLKKN